MQMDGGVTGAAKSLSAVEEDAGGGGGRWGGGEGGDGGLSADKKERKKARIQENVTATMLVAVEIRSCSPSGGAVNTKGGKRPRAIRRVFFHCIRRRGGMEYFHLEDGRGHTREKHPVLVWLHSRLFFPRDISERRNGGLHALPGFH